MVTSSVSWKGAQAAIPFAVLSATSGAGAANRLLWKGYLYDADLGCYCLGKRHYDPFALRFLEPDDIAYLDPSVPVGVNPYAYCLNDPVLFADAVGQEAVAITIGVLAWMLAAAGLLALAAIEPQTHLLTNAFGMLTDSIEEGFDALNDWVSTWNFPWVGNLRVGDEAAPLNSPEYLFFPLLEIEPNVMFAKPWDTNARAGQKKQGREMKNKSRGKFTNKCKFRNGRKPSKHHTPGKDHRKYLWWLLLGLGRDWFDEDEEDERFFQLD